MDGDARPLHGDDEGRVRDEVAALSARVAQLERLVMALQAGAGLLRADAVTPASPLPANPSALPANPSAPPPPLLCAQSTREDAGSATAMAAVAAAPGVRGPAVRERPDLENRLGSQVFNRVGIVALLVGGAWALKLAADKGWVGPVGRVVVGLMVGAALVLWSERFRAKGYAAFSYSLKAVGSGLLYLTLWAAFQLYALLPAPVALLAMVLVTVWNAYLAWRQDAELLALYALIGGFATPALLSTGQNHALFLFVYLLAIDLATALLVRSKGWSRLLIAALPSTVSLYIAWYAHFYSQGQLWLTSGYLLATMAVFTWASVGREAPARADAAKWPVGPRVLLPIATAAFAGLGLYSAMVDADQRMILPWVMLGLAAVYLGLLRATQAAVTRAVHLSLAVTFLSIAIPLKFDSGWMTVAWLAEGLALVWVATERAAVPVGGGARADQSGLERSVLRWLAAASLLLGFLGAMGRVLWPYERTAFLNGRFATAGAGLVAFALAGWLAQRDRSSPAPQRGERLGFGEIAAGCVIAFNLLAVSAVVREIRALWSGTVAGSEAELQRALAISGFLMVYGAALLAIGFAKRSAFVRWQGLILLLFSILKTFLYDMRNLSQGYRVASFIALGALLMTVSFAYQKDWLPLREHGPEPRAAGGGRVEKAETSS